MATQSITTKMAKNSSEAPISFSCTSTRMEIAQAATMGPKWRISGMPTGPMRRIATASSSRRSARYPAKNRTRQILPNSPGWKLRGPSRTQRRAPLTVLPRPGAIGSRINATPAAAQVKR